MRGNIEIFPQENFNKEVIDLREIILALDIIWPPGGTRNLSKLRPRLDGIFTIQIAQVDFRRRNRFSVRSSLIMKKKFCGRKNSFAYDPRWT